MTITITIPDLLDAYARKHARCLEVEADLEEERAKNLRMQHSVANWRDYSHRHEAMAERLKDELADRNREFEALSEETVRNRDILHNITRTVTSCQIFPDRKVALIHEHLHRDDPETHDDDEGREHDEP